MQIRSLPGPIQRLGSDSGCLRRWVLAAAAVAVLTSSIPALSGENGLERTDDPFLAKDRVDDAGTTRFAADNSLADRLTPLPEYYTVREAYPDGYVPTARRKAAGEPVLIYRNTLGTFAFRPGIGRRIGDDLWTRLDAPCALGSLRVRITGGVEGGGGVFLAQVNLYDGCPGAGGGVAEIPGSRGVFSDLDDNLTVFHDLVLDFSDRGICDDGTTCQVSQQNCVDQSICVEQPVEIPGTVWVRLRFDTDDAAVVMGMPPQFGFSTDAYDDPQAHCTAWFAGWPTYPQASFWVEMYAAPQCDLREDGLAYVSPSHTGGPYLPPGGSDTRVAEDIQVATSQCELSAIELRVANFGSAAAISIDVREYDQVSIFPRLPSPNSIAGTERVLPVSVASNPQILRAEYERGIFLRNSFWITWQASDQFTGVVPAFPVLGFSDNSVAIRDTTPPLGAWQLLTDPRNFSVVVYCYGNPTGACCANSTCYNELPLSSCLGGPRGGRFDEGRSCTDDSLDPPCSSAACCLPDGTCKDLVELECAANDGTWHSIDHGTWRFTELCETLVDPCIPPACEQGSGDCRANRLTPACGDASCCNRVCLLDPWCCEVEWDEQCVEEAYLTCALPPLNNSCETATVVSANGRMTVDNTEGEDTASSPGFTCHSDGAGTQGFASLWFRFVATHTSARLTTCASGSEADDSLLEVYGVDESDPCGTLTPIACSDDAAGCGQGGTNSDLCVTGLTLGNTYYVHLAAKTLFNRGPYRLDVQSPCPNPLSSFNHESEETSPVASLAPSGAGFAVTTGSDDGFIGPLETPDDPPALRERPNERSPAFCAAGSWDRGTFSFVQVNVDDQGLNIVGDAGNETSIAISPVDPNKMAIGFRQFEALTSNFSHAGVAYSHDAGQTWTYPGVLDPGIFRSDPVLAADMDGNFFYYSLSFLGQDFVCDMFVSSDGGVTWDGPTFARGGDKAWIAIDHTSGPGRNNIYAYWSSPFSCCDGHFTRSTSHGTTFSEPIDVPGDPFWGTITVGLDGSVYVVGRAYVFLSPPVVRSAHLQQPEIAPVFDLVGEFELGGNAGGFGSGPNPDGLLGQTWIASDHSYSATRGNLYILATAYVPQHDSWDVMFTRSEDRGFSWSQPVRVNDDPVDNGAWQWFGTISVAPNGRIDATWNDTRNTGLENLSEVFYSYSLDGGRTWTKNVAVRARSTITWSFSFAWS